MKTYSLLSMAAAGLFLAGAAQADPVSVTPGSADCVYSPSQNNAGETTLVNLCANTQIPSSAPFSLTEVYKQDVGGGETGSLAGNYTTEFFNPPNDPSDATITWDGGDFISCPECWLVVKDGNAIPTYYIFDLWRLTLTQYDLTGAGDPPTGTGPFPGTAITDNASAWDGKAQLSLTSFWPDQGAISHVALYSAPTTSTTNTTNTTNTTSTTSNVPEPASMLLIGTALLGLGFARRRFA